MALFLVGLVSVAGLVFARNWHPSSATYVFQGVDIGSDAGSVQWPTVAAAGADFAYLRATMGTDGRDTQFATNWTDADRAGIRRGAVHIWSFCRGAVDQANNFNTTVPRAADALPAAVVVDFDADCDARPDRTAAIGELKRFLTMAEAHTGKPMLMKITAPVEAMYALSGAIDRPVWATRNFFSPGYTARGWRMWQASDLRRIDGVDGPVHWDVVAP